MKATMFSSWREFSPFLMSVVYARPEVLSWQQYKEYSHKNCSLRIEETVEHLFWDCPFARQHWGSINLHTVQAGGSVDHQNSVAFLFLHDCCIIMLWTIWKARNELIFNKPHIGIQDCKYLFFQQLRLTSLRVKESLTEQFEQWT